MPCRCSSQPPEPEPIAFYRELKQDETYRAPRRWRELDVGQFDALFLVGGHAPGMRQYLGSAVVHRLVGEFWRLEGAADKAAIQLVKVQSCQLPESDM